MDKVWYISKFNGKKFKFDHVVPVSVTNENWKWNDVDEEGVEIQRTMARNFYCLVEGEELPFVVSFKGTGAKTGKVLGTQIYITNKAMQLPPPAVTMKLTAHKETNDKGTYYVWDVAPAHKTSDELIAKAFEWYQLIMAGKAVTHEEEATTAAPVKDQGEY
jgi:hypothetical protein